MSSSSQPQVINLSDLDLSQLGDVRRQFEEELNHLTNSFTQLKQAQAKFRQCIDNVNELKPQNKDKTILVPLTNSLYVPGNLSDPGHVLVDIGTGYFVKKTRAEALTHYKAKVEYIRTNLETLEETITKKRDNMNAIINVMQQKLKAQTQTTGATKA
ncbi:prefoldin subunit 5 [Moniliophthora roreri MCA 2997]|uniref:Prefoldin subunit 5 n=2 Tax=Moniliophthora roreri TaxID=221103 RepID=V2XH42_MONRO|nr:prefoldin subunit 5 [Moniliophthora roreri MCA 2997]KAI3621042.1 prefoldin subunit 5 [Moniliophthora roreri]